MGTLPEAPLTPSNTWEFDWYRALVPVSERVIEEEAKSWYGNRVQLVPRKRGKYNYGSGVELLVDRQEAGLIVWDHPQADPLVEFRGHFAIEGARFIRTRLPDHQVTRADPAVLFDFPGAWSILRRTLTRIATKHGKRTTPWGNAHDGRTIYAPRRYDGFLGITRLYEYGKHHGFDKRLIRVEHETHPQGEDRTAARTWTPTQFACYTRLQAAISDALEMDAVVAPPKPKPRYRDLMGRVDALVMANRRTLHELLLDCGGDVEAFTSTLVESLHQALDPVGTIRKARLDPGAPLTLDCGTVRHDG